MPPGPITDEPGFLNSNKQKAQLLDLFAKLRDLTHQGQGIDGAQRERDRDLLLALPTPRARPPQGAARGGICKPSNRIANFDNIATNAVVLFIGRGPRDDPGSISPETNSKARSTHTTDKRQPSDHSRRDPRKPLGHPTDKEPQLLETQLQSASI